MVFRAVILLLSSTKELATQISTPAQQLLQHTNFSVKKIMEGASIINQRERLDPKIDGFACKYNGTHGGSHDCDAWAFFGVYRRAPLLW